MYGLHLFILPSCGCVSFTVHRSSLSVSATFPPLHLYVCHPPAFSVSSICLPHYIHAAMLAHWHGSMDGCLGNSDAFALSKEESCWNATRCRQSDSVIMRCYLAWFWVWSNASKKWGRFPVRIKTDACPVISTRNMIQNSGLTLLSIVVYF